MTDPMEFDPSVDDEEKIKGYCTFFFKRIKHNDWKQNRGVRFLMTPHDVGKGLLFFSWKVLERSV